MTEPSLNPEGIDAALLPCPFCNSPATLENLSKPEHERHITAGCSNEECFAYLPSVYFAREADAIAAWNRRATLPPPADVERLVERLRPRIEGTGIWRTAGPDEDMQAMLNALLSLSARVTAAEKERDAARAGLEQEGKNHWKQRDRAEAAESAAATAIEERDRLRAALKPFAVEVERWAWTKITAGDLRRARSALSSGGKDGE